MEGVFPDCYKIAQVIPLFKGGDKEDRNCYRPISLLPTDVGDNSYDRLIINQTRLRP